MPNKSFLGLWFDALEPLDLPKTKPSNNSSEKFIPKISQKIIDDLNPLRYQEYPDQSRINTTPISSIKKTYNDSIRQSFIEWMLPS